MVAREKPALRPLRITRPIRGGGIHPSVPALPQPVPQRVLAPDWRSPTEDNGVTTPRAELHIALSAPDKATADLLRAKVRVVKPPLWKGGKIYLHVIRDDLRKAHRTLDIQVLQAIVDLGLLDSKDLDIGPPEDLTIGYPSGLKDGQT